MGHIRNNVIHSHQTPPSPNAHHPPKERDSRTLQKPYLPNQQKNFPQEHPHRTKQNKSLPCAGGCSWGKFSVREGGLEGESPVFQEGALSLQGLSPPPTHQTFIGRSRVRSWIASAMCGARITSLESRSAIVRATRRMRPYPRALNPMRSYAARSRADASSST